jgi:hypothetical protein
MTENDSERPQAPGKDRNEAPIKTIKPSETVVINDTAIPVRAYMHRRHDGCVTIDATAYENPRKLVDWDDVIDQADWLEKGIAEWREYARATGAQNVTLKAQNKLLLEAVDRLTFAAMCRENTMGDPCRLIEVKAELSDAAEHGRALAALVKGGAA